MARARWRGLLARVAAPWLVLAGLLTTVEAQWTSRSAPSRLRVAPLPGGVSASPAIRGDAPNTISGTVYEDRNYGGGPGRPIGSVGSAGVANATVELYTAAGIVAATTTTAFDGRYSFTGLADNTNYLVRVVLSTVRSTRVGSTAALLPVQTWRMEASNVGAATVANEVGGQQPGIADAGAAPTLTWTQCATEVGGSSNPCAFTGTRLVRYGGAGGRFIRIATDGIACSNAMFGDPTYGVAKTCEILDQHLHSVSSVMVGTTDVGNIDFGYSFDVVTHTGNSGAGSLAQAITNANTLTDDATLLQDGRGAGREHVVFMISNGTTGGGGSLGLAAGGLRTAYNLLATSNGTWSLATITPASASPLPTITSSLVLDAQTQPGWVLSNGPVVELSGANIGTSQIALLVSGGTVTIRGFVVNRFSGATAVAVFLTGGSNHVVAGNWLGVTNAGNAASANGTGVRITGANTATIGGTTVADRNVISGNSVDGIIVTGTNSGTRILGNYIGVGRDGATRVANGQYGVYLANGSTVAVGDSVANAGNVIAGNTNVNVYIAATATGTTVRGNLIGLSATGTAVANGSAGIYTLAPNTIIGGTSVLARNVIGSNTLEGVTLQSSGNTVQGNIIGLDPTGTATRANTRYGIYLNGASATGNLIGGNVAGAGNIISGNTSNNGIRVEGPDNVIRGNVIGLTATNATGVPNNTGILVNNVANTIIGDSVATGRNVISGNTSRGIEVSGASTTNTRIWGNYIGTDSTGTVARPNSNIGVYVQSSASGTSIGGNSAGMRNIIAGNANQGVYIAAAGTIVRGNFIGLNAANASLANTNIGVLVDNVANTIIGDSVAAGRNIISGNTSRGITIQGASATNTRIWGNYIGTDSTGTLARANTSIGVYVLTSASGTLIGGNNPGMRNIIAGNTQQGIRIDAGPTTVRGNFIGLNAQNASLPNTNHGILVNNVANTIIGDTVALGRNVISGNTNQGVLVQGANATNTRIWGNYIGTDSTGTVARANTSIGVYVLTSASGTLIGGNAPGMRNVISGNTQQGIRIDAGPTTVRGNFIGLNTLNASLPNSNFGLYIFGAANSIIGDTLASGRNVISGNTSDGVQISGAAATGSVIWGNYIGLDSTGTVARPNTRYGVVTGNSATGVTIGGRVAGARNTIAGNANTGVRLESAGNTVLGNFIGLNAANQAVANGTEGVYVGNAANSIIGDTTVLGRNIISGNTREGIQVFGAGSVNTRIWGNLIGLDSTGTVTRPNSRHGVLVYNNATGTSIGGAHPLAFNRIAGNTGLGIDLSTVTNNVDGVSLNDGLKPAGSSNLGMDAPVLTNATSNGSAMTVAGYVGSAPGQSLFGGARVDVFVADNDASGYGEGSVFLGALTADGSGNFTGTLSVPIGVTVTDGVTQLSAIATDGSGNSSEFARNVTVGLTGGSGSITGTIFEDANYGGGAGRSRTSATGWQPASNGTSRATVELYDASGMLRTTTVAAADGSYGFFGLPAGSYKVRLVTYTTPSSRSGWVNTLRPVLTYRTDASSGTVVDVTDRVGGENPLLPDTLANTGAQTLAQLTTANAQPQAVSDVLVGSGSVSGIDFGVNFSTITRTANTGQGTLRQFITNVNALAGQASLAQAGQRSRLGSAESLPAGVETSIFMIPVGATMPGLRAATPSQLTSGVATIALTSALPTLSRTLVALDGTTQTVNGGNTNALLLGSGGTAGVDNLVVPQVEGPEVQLTGTRSIDGFVISAANAQVRGFAMRTWNRAIHLTTAVNALIEENALGTSATIVADPGSGVRSVSQILLNGAATGTTIQNNLLAFAGSSNVGAAVNVSDVTIRGNEIRTGGVEANTADNIGTNSASSGNWLIRGNLITGAGGIGIDFVTGGAQPITITNNSISGNGSSGNETVGVYLGGTGTYAVTKNIVRSSRGAGVSVAHGTAGASLSQNLVYQNNTGATAGLSAGISLATATSSTRRGTTPTANDGLKPAGTANLGMDTPVFTTSAVLPSGKIRVAGYVGSAPAQSLFAGSIIELFTSDANTSGFGDGVTYLGTVTADATGAFSDSLTVPTGVTLTAGTTRLTATARDSTGNTSEFSAQSLLSGASTTLAISGTIFEDVNYGGGAGRARSTATGWAPASNGSSRATVELYDAAGTYLTRTTAAADGTYTFTTLVPGDYQVRLVTSTTPSSRSGWTTATLPVLTYRTDASSGTAVDVTDRVGGESIGAIDAGANTGAQTLASFVAAQAVTPVTLSATNVTGVDFGVHFTTVTNTRTTGAGSLRQALLNAEALGNDAGLTTAGRTAGVEHVVFMLSNGTTGGGGSLNLAGGLRTANTLFSSPGATSSVVTISSGGAAVTMRTPVIVDAQTQPGWTLHPIVEVPSMPIALLGGNSVVRGLILNSGAALSVDSVGTTVIQGNWFGLNGTGTGIGFTTKAATQVRVLGGNGVRIGGDTPAARNVFADASVNSIELNAGTGHTILGNYFGTTYTGSAPRPPLHRNILINGALVGVRIGGSAPGEGNVISGVQVPNNASRGAIAIEGTASGTIIRGNRIGIGSDSVSGIGGDGIGIFAGGSGTIIGGVLPGEANVITGFGDGAIKIAPSLVAGTQAVSTTTLSGNSIYGNGGLAFDLEGDGVSINDGALSPGLSNSLVDTPVITSATITASGALQVSGYVGTAAGQTVFGGSIVELFASATGVGLPGAGRIYLGRITAAADGTFADSLAVSASFRSGSTPITATATIADGSTSEFSSSVAVTGTATGTLTISGTVFDDRNYGGGPGRTLSEATGALPARSATVAARLELYDASGAFLTTTSVAADGRYTFGGLTTGRYSVRLLTASTPTSRTGYVGSLLPVLTFRTDAATGTALPVRDRVGGEEPQLRDAPDNDGSLALSALAAEGTTPQAVTTVAVGATSVSGVDFGVSFSAITNDRTRGAGSLRQVITNTNALGDDASLAQAGRAAGVEHAVFMLSNGTTGGGGSLNLPAGGLRPTTDMFTTVGRGATVATIAPTAPLPTITSTLVLDAQTQPGWNGATGVPIIEINGANAGSSDGLAITAAGTAVRGLIINRFTGNGLRIAGTGATVIEGNWIGINALGVAASANTLAGVRIESAAVSSRVGGPGLARRNVIASSGQQNVRIDAPSVTLQNNWIGLGADGTTVLGNATASAIDIYGDDVLVGGSGISEGNVISGSVNSGVWISASRTTVRGNRIGTDTSGTRAAANASPGVSVTIGTGHVIGGTAANEGNLIAFNGSHGVRINAGAVQASILGNTIFGNAGLGIDLLNNGLTPNDGTTTAGQANALIDHPVITSASLLPSGKLLVSGYVGTAPSQPDFADDRIELFVSDNDGTGFGEGRFFLGAIRTNLGDGSFSDSLTVPIGVTLRAGVTRLTGTTTDAAGNTSEFGANYRYGTGTLTISGTVFEDLNYGGGPGRNLTTATGWQPAVNGASRARVELYDDVGSFVSATSTAADGTYSFSGLSDGTYQVRLSTLTAPSSRSGWTTAAIPVLTYRTDATTGTPADVTNLVGGADVNRSDAADNTTALTLAQLSTATTIAQAVTPVTLAGTNASGVNFGVNFSTITSTASTGQGSLFVFIGNTGRLGGKEQLAQAGRPAGYETSIFMFTPGTNSYQAASDTWIISLAHNFTFTTPRTRLDGTTQAGTVLGDLWSGTPHQLKVQIRSNGNPFTIASDDITIRGLAIASTVGTAITVSSGSRSSVQGNYVGVDPTGAQTGTVLTAVAVGAAIDVEIGGAAATDGNVFVTTQNAITTSSTNGFTLRGNFIGTDPTGLRMLSVRPAGWTNLAGTTRIREIRRNIVAGSTGAFTFDATDVLLPVSGQGTWVIAGNHIGVGRDGVTPLPNGFGIGTEDASTGVQVTGLVIGGTVTTDRNVIAGNTGNGIQLRAPSSSVAIRGNYIGVAADGATPRGNGGSGIAISTAQPLTIGGTAAGAGNVIANNGGSGVAISEASAPVSVQGNDIYFNGTTGIDLGADGLTANDGATNASQPNAGIDSPVLTSVSLSPSGRVLVSGYVGNAPSTTLFGNTRVELFLADDEPSGFGEGRRYLGFTTADANGAFSDSVTAPAGLAFRGGVTSLTATATDLAGNTSEFGTRLTLSGGALAISGTVFDDVNYGGGAGRPRSTATGWAPASSTSARAVLELYDGSGDFITSVRTAADGTYAIGGLTAGTYAVRLVTQSAPSSRASGAQPQVTPVLTYRTGMTGSTLAAVTDRVGGENPTLPDAVANDGSQRLSDLTGTSAVPQAVSTLTLGSGSLSDVDFGVNFSTIVNTNDGGQGSLRQFIVNANALGNKAQLAQAGQRLGTTGVAEPLPAGVETSIFMIPAGSAAPGIRSTVPSALTGGVAQLAPVSAYPFITASRVSLDGTTQTVNVGNTNARMLGTGGTVGVSQIALPQVPGPEVQISGTSAILTGVYFQNASNVQVRGLSIYGFGSGIAARTGAAIFTGGQDVTVELNVLGATAISIDDPRTTGVTQYANSLVTFVTNDITVRSNIVGYGGRGMILEDFTGMSVTGNEVLGPMQFRMIEAWRGRDGLIRGNLARATAPTSAPAEFAIYVANTATRIRVEENTVVENTVLDAIRFGSATTSATASTAVGNVILRNTGPAITVVNGFGVTLSRNVMSGNTSGIDLGADGVTLNDGQRTSGRPNLLTDAPVITSASISGSTLTVAGYVGLSPNQSTFAGSAVELFVDDATTSSTGQGRTYLGTLTAGGSGAFSGSVAVPSGVTITPGATLLSATATDATGNTSEFSRNAGITSVITIAGTVFDDVNYGGGAGRAKSAATGWLPAANGTQRATLELYDANGLFLATTQAQADGTYAFSGFGAGAYLVRLVTPTAPSGRSGWTNALRPVLTYRTNASSGVATPVTDVVGGDEPALQDTTANTAGLPLSLLTSATARAQAVAPVTLGATGTSDVDFGISFTTVTSTRDAGAGSLRQVIANANTLGGDASLAQASRTAGTEHVVFMLPNGTTGSGGSLALTGGLRTAQNVFTTTAGATTAATITPATALPAITVPLVLDATAQPGWTAQPRIELSGASIAANNAGLTLDGAASLVRGFVINRFTGASGTAVRLTGGSGHRIVGNWLGLDAAGTAAAPNGHGVIALASSGDTITANIVSGNGSDGILLDAASSAIVVTGNTIGEGQTTGAFIPNGGHGILVRGNDHRIGGRGTGAGNRIAGNTGAGISVQGSASNNTFAANVITANGALGIDLAADGVTVNDGVTVTGQPNRLMDAPVLTAAAVSGGALVVSGYVGSAPGQTAFGNALVELFVSDADASGHGEAQAVIDTVRTDASGRFARTITGVSGIVAGSTRVTATATDALGNTSEFAANLLTTGPLADVVTTLTGPTTGFAGNVLPFVITVKNLGPVVATAIVPTVTLQAGVNVLSAGGGSVTDSVVTWPSIATLAAGDSVRLPFTVTALTAGTYAARAASTMAVPDPDSTNNDGSAPAARVSTVLGNGADVIVTSRTVPPFNVGAPATLVRQVANVGNTVTGSGVTLTDSIPTGLTVVSAAATGTSWSCNQASSVVTCAGPAMSPGDSSIVTITLTVANAAAPLARVPSVMTTTGDVVAANDRIVDSIPVGSGIDVVARASAAPFTVGVDGQLRVVATNIGSAPTAAPLVLDDTLPGGLQFRSTSSAGWSCTATGAALRCDNPAPLAPGDSSVVTLALDVLRPAAPSASIPVRVRTTGDLQPSNDTTRVVVPVGLVSDARVAITVSPYALPGSVVQDTIAVTNLGPSPADTVQLFASASPRLTISGITGACSALPCTLTNLASGERRTTIVSWAVPVDYVTPDPVVFSAHLSARSVDPVRGNDSTSATSSLNAGTVAGLVFEDRNGNAAQDTGEPGVPAVRVTLLAVTGDTLRTTTAPDGTWQYVGVPVGAVTITTIDSTAGGGFVRTTATGTQTTTVPLRATVSTTPVGLQYRTDIVATLRGPATTNVGVTTPPYRVAVYNRGAGTASAVVARVTLPSGMTLTRASDGGVATNGVIAWPVVPTLAAGDSLAYTFATSALAPGSYTLAAAATTTTVDVSPLNNDGSDSTARVLTQISGGVDIAVTRTLPTTLTIGQPATLLRTVRNVGVIATIAPVVLTDSLPTGVQFTGATGTGWTCAEAVGVVTCTLASLAVGDSSAVSILTRLTPAAWPSVRLWAQGATTADVNLANNLALDSVTVSSGVDLAMRTSADSAFTVGKAATVRHVIGNIGTGPTVGPVTITDTLPAGLTFRSATGSGWNCTAASGVLQCVRPDTLAAGDSTALALSLDVARAAMPSVTLRSQVATLDERVVNNNASSLTVSVRGDFVLFAEVTAQKSVADLGDPVDFTGTVKVVGESPVPDVGAVVTLPRGFGYQPGTLYVSGANTAITPRTLRGPPGTTPTVALGGALLSNEPELLPDGTMRIALGDLASGAVVSLRWRVRLGPGSQRSDGNTRLQAVSAVTASSSNVSKAQVRVRGGVFTDRGIIFGKVFLDCACDESGRATQETHEVGVPGVRLVMEDGTSVITDAEGKYSLPGLAPRLHVVRVDASSLPDGAALVITGNRNAGNAASRFVDLTNGEFQKADFAIARRDGVLEAVRERRRTSLTTRVMEPTPEGYGVRSAGATAARRDDGGMLPMGPGTRPTVARAARDSNTAADTAAANAPGLLTWTPRRFLAAGLLHGRLELRQFTRGLPKVDDGFDAALRSIARQTADSSQRAGVRGAFYASGDIARRTRLTLAFDSERDRDIDLLRDITPDDDYAVFGDASIREFDARSAGGLTRTAGRGFARLDHERSTLLLGDFTAPAGDDARRLSAYDRTMTGLREHLELGDERRAMTVDGFVSRTTLAQRVEELPGEGISGPYQLSRADVKANSEQVELVVRDRNQSALVLSRTPLGRFTDYTIERDAGRLLFRAPVPSVDANLNPVSIRVSYEVDQGGEAYVAYGADARVTLGDAMLGIAAVRDENPLGGRALVGVHGSLQLGGTTLFAEAARSDGAPVSTITAASLDAAGQRTSGDAGRIELRRQGARVNFRLSGVMTSTGFANPSALQPAGRTELGGNGSVTLTQHTRLLLQMLHTEDRLTGGRRDGALASVEQQFWSRMRVELGVRWAEENRSPVRSDSTLAAPILQPSSLAALRSRVTVDLLRGTRFRSSVSGEFEQDLRIREQQRAAVSGDLGFARGARMYARHEFLRSAGGPFALGSSQQQASTVVGLTADVRTNQQLFNEYRLRDGMSGRQAEGAFGLRNRLRVDSGIVINTSFERVTPIGGDTVTTERATSGNRTLALTGGVELTRWSSWRATARTEFRRTPQGNSWLGSAGLAQQITRGLTFLGRGVYSRAPQQDRFRGQLGLALRPVDDNVWNALLRLDERTESSSPLSGDTTASKARIASLHLNVQPRGTFGISSRYAFKRGIDERTSATLRIATRSITQLVAARALWDLTPSWDAALQGSLLGDASFGSRQTGLGLSFGRRVMRDLRVAGGYNLFGWTDADLAGSASTTRGLFVEFGYKFDETSLRLR